MDNLNSDVIRGLRDAADFLEWHPELPRARWATVILRYPGMGGDARTELTALAKALGDRAEENRFGSEVNIDGPFDGGLTVKAVASITELLDDKPLDPPYEPIIPPRFSEEVTSPTTTPGD